MKRVCAMICLTMLIVAQTLNINVKASITVPFEIDPTIIGSLGDLGYGLAGGASFDFTDSKYKIDGYANMTEAERDVALRSAAVQFCNDYAVMRGTPYYDYANPDSNIALTPKDYYYTNYFKSTIRQNWNNYKIAEAQDNQVAVNQAMLFPLSPDKFADWTNYSTFWYEKYKESLKEVEDAGSTVNPDPNYLSYIDLINGNGFYWKNFDNLGPYAIGGIRIFPPYLCSWITKSDVNINSNNDYIMRICCTENILDLYINSTDNIYSFNISITPTDQFYYANGSSAVTNQGQIFKSGSFGPNGGTGSFSLSYSGTLANTLNYVSNHFRNINLYIDGVAWSLAGAPANPLIPTFPDVIGGTDDDPLPAYDIVMPGTANNEGAFDITSLFDAIKIAIAGASDDDASTDGTLTKEAIKDALRDKDGTAVKDEAVPADTVIDPAIEAEATSRLPNIDIFPQPIENAFSGTTILASFVDALNNLLPDAIVVVFWGIFWVLLIIAIIKSMHR